MYDFENTDFPVFIWPGMVVRGSSVIGEAEKDLSSATKIQRKSTSSKKIHISSVVSEDAVYIGFQIFGFSNLDYF